MRVGGDRAEDPLQLADAVAHRVVVEELGRAASATLKLVSSSTCSVSRRSAASGVRSASGPSTSARTTRARRRRGRARAAGAGRAGRSGSPIPRRAPAARSRPRAGPGGRPRAARPGPCDPADAGRERRAGRHRGRRARRRRSGRRRHAPAGAPAGSTGTRVTTSRLKATEAIAGRPSPRPAATRGRSGPATPGGPPASAPGPRSASGSSTATTTITGRSRSQPNACACSATYSSLAGPAEEHVAEEVALVLVLHRRDRLHARHQQRGHDRGALEGLHVGGVDLPSGRSATSRARSTPPRPPRGVRRLPVADGGAVRVDALHPQPTGRVEQVGVGQRARWASSRCAARSRPSVEVKTTP